jgi:GDPmannose 4,6-dehydratase
VYRDAYGLFIVSGILFNNESERRGLNFVTRKIAHNVALIKKGKIDNFTLGNLDAKRDWGYTPEYVEVIWKMLQLENPDDFVIGTGEPHTIREFVEEAFKVVGFNSWEEHILIDQTLKRAKETDYLCADSSKARRVLGWNPKVKFKEIVQIMVDSEMNQTN